MRRGWTCLILAASALLLSGCATVMRVDNEVRSFPQWPDNAPQKGERFAFERLPSQQNAGLQPLQDAMERAVSDALKAWGLQLPSGNEGVRWLVQVTASGQRLPRAPWDPDPWYRSGWYLSGGVGGRHGGVTLGFPLVALDSPYYLRELTVVVRDGASGRVVFESKSRHDGRWPDSPALWAAMAQAAVADFPRPAAGARQINIDIPR